MEITEKKLTKILKDQSEENRRHNDLLEEDFKRHSEVLYEKFRSDIKIIGEGWSAIRKKTDATFEMVGDIKEDVEMLKIYVSKNTEDISIIKSDISIIKNDLKQKVDRDEFSALEKRVIFLENKIRKA